MSHDFDVIVVGAGLSGIGAAARLQRDCPSKSLAILEARDATGGTWDLFRYPGVRSDSDMYTYGYGMQPWTGDEAIGDGASILSYLRQTAREHGLDPKIRLGHRVVRAEWSTADARWTLDVERGAAKQRVQYRARFLYVCAGYYDYDAGYAPELPGAARYAGRIVHPQQWPEDLDYAGKRVIVIGSGATAMTLVPALARSAAHVTMLQRSPTYVMSLPAKDPVAAALRAVLPDATAATIVRWKNAMLGIWFYWASRKYPSFMHRFMVGHVKQRLGGSCDAETHFTPRYAVCDQRVCLVPDDDLFVALKNGRAEVVTDRIARLTERGIALESGRELEADVVVTATGFRLKLLGGIEVLVDGERTELSRKLSYKGSMLSDVPNFAHAFGYTNLSWTLKADITAQYVARLLAHMDACGARQCTPRVQPHHARDGHTEPFLSLSSGYVQRALDQLPLQGSKPPWRLHTNYVLDRWALRRGAIDDGVLELLADRDLERRAFRCRV